MKRQPFRKKCYRWKRTRYDIDIDDIGNLEDSPGLVLIDEECDNLIVANDGGELLEILNKDRYMIQKLYFW